MVWAIESSQAGCGSTIADLLCYLVGDDAIEWRQRAACRGMDVKIFFPDGADHHERPHLYDEARRVCSRCPVVSECREAGAHERTGMWGGLSPTQRFPKRRVRVQHVDAR